jgi:hypothetical protein
MSPNSFGKDKLLKIAIDATSFLEKRDFENPLRTPINIKGDDFEGGDTDDNDRDES